MSNIAFVILFVALVETISVDGQSTLGNDLTFAADMQSTILDELRYVENRISFCIYNCSQLKDFLGPHFNNVTQNLRKFTNWLDTLDKNVRSVREFSDGLQSKFQNLSRLSDQHDETIQAVDRLLDVHDGYSTIQTAGSSYSRQDIRSIVQWPRDCADIRKVGQNVSDVYRVYSLGPGSMPVEISVYCDMDSSDASWLVFQRRKDGSENFTRNWANYTTGFGNLTGEFWLGNNALHLLTSNRNCNLRIELEDFEGGKRYAEYKQFSVGSASDNYRLSVSGYSGNAGDNLEHHNGQLFSTMDSDHDSSTEEHCAVKYHGAWWYNKCHSANLNGQYLRGSHETLGNGIVWFSFRGHYYSLKKTEMKIAPRN